MISNWIIRSLLRLFFLETLSPFPPYFKGVTYHDVCLIAPSVVDCFIVPPRPTSSPYCPSTHSHRCRPICLGYPAASRLGFRTELYDEWIIDSNLAASQPRRCFRLDESRRAIQSLGKGRSRSLSLDTIYFIIYYRFSLRDRNTSWRKSLLASGGT